MKFANLIVDSKVVKNIGDDMQIFAIEYLYKYMGIDYNTVCRIPVSELRLYSGEDVILPINFPFQGMVKLSENIIPVYIGLSLYSGCVAELMQLRKYEPIGCRDIYTYYELQKRGIDAYVNGCLTMTLPKNKNSTCGDKYFIVDAPDKLMPYIPEYIIQNAEYVRHVYFDDELDKVNEEYTRRLYDKYKREAKMVITSRMHCAIPCIAAGIPTIFACEKKSSRFHWLENLIPIYIPEFFSNIDWNPSPLDFEEEKKVILENASEQVWSVYHKCKKRSLIKSFYMNNNADYDIDCIPVIKEYLNRHWDKESKYTYIFWGVTQTTEVVYEFIKSNYPKAKLTGVIDMFHNQKYHGIQTSSTDIIINDNTTIFVTAKAANEDAIKIFKEKGISTYLLCHPHEKSKLRLPVNKG